MPCQDGHLEKRGSGKLALRVASAIAILSALLLLTMVALSDRAAVAELDSFPPPEEVYETHAQTVGYPFGEKGESEEKKAVAEEAAEAQPGQIKRPGAKIFHLASASKTFDLSAWVDASGTYTLMRNRCTDSSSRNQLPTTTHQVAISLTIFPCSYKGPTVEVLTLDSVRAPLG